MRWTRAQTSPEQNAVAGMVRIHATTIRSATPQRTAEALIVEPTPKMLPVIVWVVETGIPMLEAAKSVIAPAVSAQDPPIGFNFVIFIPIVCTIRQPPKR